MTRTRLGILGFALLSGAILVNLFFLQPPRTALMAGNLDNEAIGAGEDAAKLRVGHNGRAERRLRLSEQPRITSRRSVLVARRGQLGEDTLSDVDRSFDLDSDIDTQDSLATPAQGEADVQTLERPSPKLVRAIQRELTTKSYMPGPVDGILGTMTQAAIMAFQFDNKLPVTGTPSELLLKRIIFGSSYVILRPEEKRVSRVTAVRITRSVQKTLGDLGYAPGRANGRLNKNLRNAIREFETDRKLVPSGRVSGRLIREITKATGVALANSVD